MKDIETRDDIIIVMKDFYESLLKDQSINFFFIHATNVTLHLEKHFEILADFWEQGLFLKGGYGNNMFQMHKNIHDKYPFTQEHYEIWLDYFYTAIDSNFEGKNADMMKTMALNMATVMKIKFT